jgi:hypothetical protein
LTTSDDPRRGFPPLAGVDEAADQRLERSDLLIEVVGLVQQLASFDAV